MKQRNERVSYIDLKLNLLCDLNKDIIGNLNNS